MKGNMRNSGALTGLLGLIIAAIAYGDARKFPLQNLENGLRAAFFPLLVIVFLTLLSFLALLLSALGKCAQQDLDLHGEGTSLVAWLLVLLILFAVAFSHFGLFVSAMVFIALASWLLGSPPKYAVLTGIAGGAAVRVLFINILNVHLT